MNQVSPRVEGKRGWSFDQPRFCLSSVGVRRFRFFRLCATARIAVDEIEYHWPDVVAPAFASENAVVASTWFDVAGLHVVWQTGTKVQGCETLAGRRDIVFLALDCFYGNLGDGPEIDLVTGNDKIVFGNFAILEDAFDG